ncbi:unnamed protein product [Rangifer tarandus platyrhynchus]|uniref:Uncharacterized protein n=1 Tax=Rangifer tarandus platyrhynchus TaxID=3082113 RepID=A0AC59ZQV7_RANTA
MRGCVPPTCRRCLLAVSSRWRQRGLDVRTLVHPITGTSPQLPPKGPPPPDSIALALGLQPLNLGGTNVCSRPLAMVMVCWAQGCGSRGWGCVPGSGHVYPQEPGARPPPGLSALS